MALLENTQDPGIGKSPRMEQWKEWVELVGKEEDIKEENEDRRKAGQRTRGLE